MTSGKKIGYLNISYYCPEKEGKCHNSKDYYQYTNSEHTPSSELHEILFHQDNIRYILESLTTEIFEITGIEIDPRAQDQRVVRGTIFRMCQKFLRSCNAYPIFNLEDYVVQINKMVVKDLVQRVITEMKEHQIYQEWRKDGNIRVPRFDGIMTKSNKREGGLDLHKVGYYK